MSDYAVATVHDDRVEVSLPDGSTRSIPHRGRAVAGLCLSGWVAECVRDWSNGTAVAEPETRPSRGTVFLPLGEILGNAADTRAVRFVLRPVRQAVLSA